METFTVLNGTHSGKGHSDRISVGGWVVGDKWAPGHREAAQTFNKTSVTFARSPVAGVSANWTSNIYVTPKGVGDVFFLTIQNTRRNLLAREKGEDDTEQSVLILMPHLSAQPISIRTRTSMPVVGPRGPNALNVFTGRAYIADMQTAMEWGLHIPRAVRPRFFSALTEENFEITALLGEGNAYNSKLNIQHTVTGKSFISTKKNRVLRVK